MIPGVVAGSPQATALAAALYIQGYAGNQRLGKSLDSGATISIASGDFSTPSYVLALKSGRVLCFAGNVVRKTDDEGMSVVVIDNIDATFGSVGALCGGVVLWASNGSKPGVARGLSNGDIWDRAPLSEPIAIVGAMPTLAVAIANTSKPAVSTDQGAAWSPFGGRLDSGSPDFNPTTTPAATDNTRIMFAGSTWGGSYGVSDFIPAVATTLDGINFSITKVQAVPSSGHVKALARGGQVWVAVLSSGDIYKKLTNDPIWTYVTTIASAGSGSVFLQFTGTGFVLVASPQSSPQIFAGSINGDSWEEMPPPGFTTISSVSARSAD